MRRAVASVCVGVVVAGLSVAVSGPAAAAPAGPGRASAAHVSAIGAHTLRVSWHNPPARDHRRTEVRVLRGATAPRTVHQGRRAGRVGASAHTVSVAGLASATTYTFAVFSSDGRGHVARPAVVRATTVLEAPRYPRAYGTTGATVVQWRNPARALRRVVVRYAHGTAAPTTPRRGTGVMPSGARAATARLTGLAADTRYAVSVFALDAAGRPSAPAVTRFTTAPAGSAPTRPPGTYRGTVVDSDGTPLANADVAGFRATGGGLGGQSVNTTSAPDGTFVLDLPPGSWYVGASGENAVGGNSDRTGYLYDELADQVVTSGATVSGVRFVLGAGAEITGRVTDGEHRPIEGASAYPGRLAPYVRAGYSAGAGLDFAPDLAVDTAADGTWTMRGVSPGLTFHACAYAENVTVAGQTGDYATRCANRATVASAGVVTTVPTVELHRAPGGSVTGRLRGADGRALRGYLELDLVTPDDDFGFGGFGETGPDGTFRIDAVPAGTYRVCAGDVGPIRGGSRTGYAPGCATGTVRVTAGRTSTSDVVLARGAAVSGTLTGPKGRPLSDVAVIVAPPKDADEGAYQYAATDTRGHWTAVGATPGPHQICFAGNDTPSLRTGALAQCWDGGRPVGLTAGRVRIGIDGRLRAAGAVAGTLLDAAGRPVQGAEVDLGDDTDGDGDDDDTVGGSPSDETDAKGDFLITGVPAGKHRVCYFLDTEDDTGAERCAAGTVTVRLGHVAGPVALRTPRPTAISVRVRDAAGLPVAAVDATAVAPCSVDDGDVDCSTVPLLGTRTGVVESSRLTDGDGVALLDGLAPGPHTVCLYAYFGTTVSGGSPTGYADACAGTAFDVQVRRGTTTTLTVTLAAGGSVSGTIRSTSGEPVAGARVTVPLSAADDNPYPAELGDPDEGEGDGGELQPPDPGSPDAGSRTAADGTYSVIGVRPGSTTVCVSASSTAGAGGGYLPQCLGGTPGRSSGGTRVTVAAGQDTSHTDLTVTPGAGLSGQVTLSGRPTTEADVYVLTGRSAREVHYARIGAHGRWHVGLLAPGDYTVCVTAYDSTSGLCWRHVRWADTEKRPPLARATVLTVAAGASRTGIDFALTRR